MNLRFTEYINKGLVFVLLLMFASTLGASIYFSYTMLSLNSLIQQGGSDVKATFLLQDLMLNVRSAESGQRGYIITGDKQYLAPYTAAVKRIPADLRQIASQASFSGQSDKVKELQTLANDKLAELAKALKARQNGGFEGAAALVDTNEGAILMRQINVLAQEIGAKALNSIGPKQNASRESLHHSLYVAVILDVFVLALCVFIVRYFHETIVRERAIEGAKNEFLSLASHQLRTPATSVKQYLGMVNGGYFGKLTPEQKEALDIAYQSNESEISIINNLLNVAKLNLEKIQITKKPVVVSSLVKSVIDEYRPQANAAKQSLKFTNKLKQRQALLDATYFKTVVENLVDNAVKYSPEGAKISLELVPITVPKLPKKEKTPTNFRLLVSDTGVGIGRRDQSKLFKKFSRVPGLTTDAVEGSGLGLYWVKQIVERHDGHISVRSDTRGGGTTFAVDIPFGMRPDKQKPKK